jgi:hypothetical protein
MSRKALLTLVLVPTVLMLGAAFYHLPPVHSRLSWRVEAVRAQIYYKLNPPEEVVFVPQEQVAFTPTTLPTASPTLAPTPTATPEPDPGLRLEQPTPVELPTGTPAPTPTALPKVVTLSGVKHEYQKWNNCGPANLSMALSYWGWTGDQRPIAAALKPNDRDKNVMPYEMADYVNEQTDFRALVRMGGDLELLKAFIAAGIPPIVEKGFEGANFDGWMGHYEVVTGYDDGRQRFIVQDSYIKANLPVSYEELESNWRAFNFLYIIVYPPEREAEVMAILGPDADETENFQRTARKASDEIFRLTGRDQYFAWFNRGTSLVRLQDYTGAADAYDQAFSLYAEIPKDKRPYRMMWYQTGPYFAYFYTQRYYDTLALATTTIASSSEPAIEESFLWRARAFYELYKLEGKPDHRDNAIADYRTSLQWHPDFGPALYDLRLLGLEP